jgi:5-methylcytosine-specific restriction endonuclease McrA
MTKRTFPKINLTGKRFGRLIVVKFSHFHEDSKLRRHNMWTVSCDCGKLKPIRGSQLTSGGTISCGCALKEEYKKLSEKTSIRNKKPNGLAAFNELLNSYMQRARSHKIEFNLTNEEFRSITSKNCAYCGVQPLQISPVPARRALKKVNGYYHYNGIDRLNSSLGYTISNCVPCCEICNKAKRDLTLKEFTVWINRLMKFQSQKIKLNLLEEQQMENS